ncbi:carbamoyltransferase HypF [Eggerthella sp. YY7918]|uniref:carbamoyltransferase HypF n=1 Tax=Eggerthella sp. (strain YY7918) TaxID=502558 RepID=UPI0002171070|nr:carbamoyltransferase HypF [Eggerthella sp. YY7918]BAK43413.1 hydrogenase maturation factor [Eggerthella sp. YY7918]
MIEALDIQVKGIVQGVGFRPFVYRMAKKYLINGWVLNATDGVFIHAEAESKLLDEFVLELSENPPAASRVEKIELKEVPLEDFDSFEIRFSDSGAVEKTTLVSPDLATCDDCANELFNPNDRRFRYPFINCTNCGPRFTIIEKLPYDRKSTSMKDFPMCERCAAEYGDPLDRRFHAQPDACFECGPHLSWREHEGLPDASDVPDTQAGVSRETREATDAINASLGPVTWGITREESDAILARAVELLLAGKILAVKGLGGFHLVCDANNADAVALLRTRKRREGKAFAVMMGSVDDVRRVCSVNDAEEAALTGSQRPIVLLKKRADALFAPGLADDLPELGVMLPYTPLQHLLLHDFEEATCHPEPSTAQWAVEPRAPRSGAQGNCTSGSEAEGSCAVTAVPPMLVMTSGNIHDEPIVIDDEDAYEKLFGVADAFLGHDRAIRARYDDSVVRIIRAGSAGDAIQFIRRARGYAPLPVSLACQPTKQADCCDAKLVPSIFATGPEQKNTFTLTRDSEAFVSQHIGDMENAETYDAWLAAKQRYETLFEINPTRIACDLHPEYLTSKWAHDQARTTGVPLTEVQHHHAHIAAVMGEHGLTDAVCGIAFDGTGYGMDGAIWGGEVLLANLRAFERFANFAYVPMPGGAAAVKHPLRMAYGVLWAFDLLDHPGAARALEALGSQAAVCDQMIEQGINTPMTSSVGRLFDAASALLSICSEPAYEGEPAILLEAAMGSAADGQNTQTNVSRETFAASQSEVASATQSEAATRAETEAAPQAQAEDNAADQVDERYAIAVVKNTATAESTAQDTSVVLFDAAPTFAALLDDLAAGVPVSVIARRFHDAFVQAIVMAAELVRSLYGIETVALSGGVFMNRYVVEHTLSALEESGFTAAVNRDLPPNDGCISFGQAVVAWATNEESAATDDA